MQREKGKHTKDEIPTFDREVILGILYIMEIWKKVKGFDSYEVSDLGNVRSLERSYKTKNRWGECGNKKPSVVLRQVTTVSGYKKVVLYRDKKPYNKVVHRLVAEAFIENPNKKPHVNHKDADRTNNKVSNLEWCTPSENVLYSFKLGLSNQGGDKNNGRKVSSKEVLEVRRRKREGERAEVLAKEFGVHRNHINLICRKGAWKDV